MRINTVEYGQRKNLGDYEWRDVKIGAAVEEGESLNDCMTRLRAIVEWTLNASEREAKYLQFTNELKSDTCDKREQKEKWVAQFEERKAEMEAI